MRAIFFKLEPFWDDYSSDLTKVRQGFEEFMQVIQENANKVKFKIQSFPVDTRRRFNVYKTSIQRRRHRIDVL